MTVNVPFPASGGIRGWWSGLSGFWRAQIVGWGLFGIIDFINQRMINTDLHIAAARTAAVVPALVLISVAMASLFGTRRFENRLSWHSAVWVGLISLGGAALVSGIVLAGRELIGWATPGRDGLEEFVLPWTHYALALAGWSLCYFWIHAEMAEQVEHRRAMHAEAEALRAELEELRLQLDPHFLFNALNGLAEEIPEHPAAALAMLRDLTAYLRHSLEGIHQTVFPVEAEVQGLDAYLGVQRARFGPRLEATVDVDPGASRHRIASYLLQPLVENAVKHGAREHGLQVAVTIRTVPGGLHIEIANGGRLQAGPAPRRRRRGVGLENVRRRLALHYPGRHRFELTQAPNADRVLAILELEGEPCSAP